MKIRTTITTTAALVALAAGAAAAQSRTGDQGSQQWERYQNSRQSQQDQQSSRENQSQQRRQSQQSQQGQQSPGQWDAESVTIIGYDLDRDGRTDAWYYITEYEYERMRRDQARGQGQPVQGRVSGRPMYGQGDYRSGQQQMQERNTPYWQNQRDQDRRMQAYNRGTQQQMRQPIRQPQNQQIRGELTDLTTFTLAPDGQKHFVGKLELQNGRTLPVHFGRADDVGRNLQKGDQIAVMGRVGMLNGRRIILADRVMTQDGRYSIRPTADQNLKQCSGTIVETKTVALQDGGHAVLANVRKDDGRTEIVALGKREDIRSSDVNLQQGKQVSILGRPIRIDGRPVVVADRIYADGKSVKVDVSPSNLRAASEFQQTYQDLRSAREARAETGGND